MAEPLFTDADIEVAALALCGPASIGTPCHDCRVRAHAMLDALVAAGWRPTFQSGGSDAPG
jgi:hypothetical protein